MKEIVYIYTIAKRATQGKCDPQIALKLILKKVEKLLGL